MRQRIGHGLVLSSMCLLALSVATGVQAQTVNRDSHGIRHETLTVGPVHAQETVGGRSGTGTYFYSYSYINARDAINAILQTAQMSTGGNVENNDVTNLVADVKNGTTSLQSLSNMILGPNGVGDSSLPGGFHSHDATTWNSMGFDNSDWSARYSDAVGALNGACSGDANMSAAQSCIQQQISSGNLGSWDFQSIFNTLGWDFSFTTYTSPEDTYLKGFMGDLAPHYVPIVALTPGSGLQYLYHSWSELTNLGSTDPNNNGQTYVAVSYFLSQAQRWINTQTALANLGAGDLGAQALEFARDDAGILSDTGDPLVLDLDHKGYIEVTGHSSAILRAPKNMPFVSAGSVLFDLYGGGPKRMEWVRGGDGLVVNAASAKKALADGRPLTGRDLLGDAGGRPGGFATLSTYDHQHAGKIVGKDLNNLMVWVDHNHNGRLDAGELYSMKQLGISEIDYGPHFKYDKDHEPLEYASFVQHGKRYSVQEVWFAFKPQHLASRGGN